MTQTNENHILKYMWLQKIATEIVDYEMLVYNWLWNCFDRMKRNINTVNMKYLFNVYVNCIHNLQIRGYSITERRPGKPRF